MFRAYDGIRRDSGACVRALVTLRGAARRDAARRRRARPDVFDI